MIAVLAIVWAVSAAVCWEAQADMLRGQGRSWCAITIGSLMPVYNTIVAVGYAVHSLKKRC